MRTGAAMVALPVACALAGAGCAEEFKPESYVAGLRVLGVRSEPAELHPGDAAQLSALVVDPTAPTRQNTLLWLACDPDPYGLGITACSDVDTLADPTRLFGPGDGGAPQFPPGMSVIGFGEQAAYAVPAGLFSVLPQDDRRRQVGTVAQVLLFAIAEEPPLPTQEAIDAMLARVRSRETPSVVTLFRIRVTEQSPLNLNPTIEDVLLDGERVPDGAHVALRTGEQVVVDVTTPPAAYETFDQLRPEGVETLTERMIAALYATGGEFSEERFAVGSDVTVAYTAPTGDDDDPLPAPGAGKMWIVLRDTRGGAAWRELPMHLCEPVAEPPTVTRLSPDSIAAGSEALVRFEGGALGRVLDVFVGPAAVRQLTASADGTLLQGRVGPLSAGDHPVRLKARDCTTWETGLVLLVP